jgi:hypothetical protein
MTTRFLLTPFLLGSFLALSACSSPSAESVDSTSGAETASCATTNLYVASGVLEDLRGAMAEGAATDPNSVEVPGGLKVVRSADGVGETISTVMGVDSTSSAGPGGVSGAILGESGLDGPLGVASSNAAKALFAAMKGNGAESAGTITKKSGPINCMKSDVQGLPPYFCRITSVSGIAHGFGFSEPGTTLTVESGTIAAIRDALKPEFVTANGFAISGSLSAIQGGSGPEHITSVDGTVPFITHGPGSLMTARFGGFDFGEEGQVTAGGAAAKVFAAMARATVTQVPSKRLTLRTSPHGRIVCQEVRQKAWAYSCSIVDVRSESISEGPTAAPGFCSEH